MNCPGCGACDSAAPKTIDGPKSITRMRSCRSCRGSWRTHERVEPGSFKPQGQKPYTAEQGQAAGGISPNGGFGGSGLASLPGLGPDLNPEVSVNPERARARRGRGDATEYPAEFEIVWAGCNPKRGVKYKAFKAWVKLKPTSTVVLPAYGLWLKTDQWRRGIIPYLSTWLNGRAWETEPDQSEFVERPGNGYQRRLTPAQYDEEARQDAALARGEELHFGTGRGR